MSDTTSSQYQAGQYTYRVLRDGDGFTARCAEFPNLSWTASTPEYAHTELVKLVNKTLGDLAASGGEVPAPEIPFTPNTEPEPRYYNVPPSTLPVYPPESLMPTVAFPSASRDMPYYYPMPPVQQMAPPPMPNIMVNTSSHAHAGPGYYRRGVNHGLHATLTLLTCGAWAPVWAFVWLVSRR